MLHKDSLASSLLPKKQAKESHSCFQKTAERRNYSQLTADDEIANSTNVTFELDSNEADKKFLERTFLQKHVWRNPSFLNDTLKDYYLHPNEKGRPRSGFSEINHWPFTTKTERALIQDILLMLIGVESETFSKNEQSMFERKIPIQLTHTSPDALAHTIHKFISLSNIIFEVASKTNILRENFITTVIEGYLECLDEYSVEYKSFIEDIQCIFLKQASQGK